MFFMLEFSLSQALSRYRAAAGKVRDEQARADLSNIASVADRLLAALKRNDIEAARLEVLGFSRSVSDTFATQPPEFRSLARVVAEIRRKLSGK